MPTFFVTLVALLGIAHACNPEFPDVCKAGDNKCCCSCGAAGAAQECTVLSGLTEATCLPPQADEMTGEQCGGCMWYGSGGGGGGDSTTYQVKVDIFSDASCSVKVEGGIDVSQVGSTFDGQCLTDENEDAEKLTCLSSTKVNMKVYESGDCTGSADLDVDFTKDVCTKLPGSFTEGQDFTYAKMVTLAGCTGDGGGGGGGGGGGSSSDDDPCFARSATACRISDTKISPEAAFSQCFGGEAPSKSAERVSMTELRAGDYVLSDMGDISRVIVNQHTSKDFGTSSVVQLDFGAGRLALTPDHVIKAGGEFIAAREVVPGSMLGEFKVERVARGVEGVINPLTVAGTILAAGKEGQPVVASVYPEWIAAYMLNSATVYPLPLSLASGLTYLFPSAAQAFYDAVLEPLFAGGRRGYLEAIPLALLMPAIVVLDLAIAAAFLGVPALLGVALAKVASRK